MIHQRRMIAGNLPHILAVLQALLLIFDAPSFLNIPSIVTGRKIGESRKVITPFQLWVFAFSLVLVLLFYLVREKSVVERSLFLFSILACLSSSLNLAFFLVNNFLMGMQITAILTMGFYVAVFVISASKISILLLIHAWRKARKKLTRLIHIRQR